MTKMSTMIRFVTVFACFLLTLLAHNGAGFLLTGISLPTNIPKLPQYALYGRSMVLVGGNLAENNTEIYDKIVDMAGGRGKAKLGIINAASLDPNDSYQYYRDLFIKYGVLEASFIPIDLNHTQNAANQSVIDLIHAQTGFFFGGGDQTRIIRTFLDEYGDFTPALIALHQMFDAGAVIAGTSAGTTCQTSNIMIQSGTSYDALVYGSYPDVGFSDGKYDEMIYASSGGIGFMKGYVLDSHFSNRGREGRMIRVLADTHHLTKGTVRGIGIDENTALVISHADTANMTGQVIGQSGVSFFDLSRATVRKEQYIHISDVYMTYLTHNDVYHFNNKSAVFAQTKYPMTGHEEYDTTLFTRDIFYGIKRDRDISEFVRVATSTFDARLSKRACGLTYEAHPTFVVDVTGSGHDAEGWGEKYGSNNKLKTVAYENLNVEIKEDDGQC